MEDEGAEGGEEAVRAAREAVALQVEDVRGPGLGGGEADEGLEKGCGGLREEEEGGEEVEWKAVCEGQGRVEEANAVERGDEAVGLMAVG